MMGLLMIAEKKPTEDDYFKALWIYIPQPPKLKCRIKFLLYSSDNESGKRCRWSSCPEAAGRDISFATNSEQAPLV